MSYSPGAQFDPNLIFQGIAGAGASIGAGISDEQKKRKQLEEQNAFNQTAFQTLSNAKGADGQPLLSEEEKQSFLKGNINAQNGIITGAGARLMQVFQQKQHQDQFAKSALENQLQRKMLEKSNQPIMMTAPNGQSYQAGMYDPRGTPHFLPYGGAANQFMPPEETMNAMKSAGYTYAPTSRGAGRWINTDGNKPDLGPDGNPIISPDGTTFISGGKVKPLTQPMIDQRKEYLQKIEDAKKAVGPHWYDSLIPDALKSKPTQTTTSATTLDTPVKVNTVEEANALPSGTIFVTPDGRVKKKP